MKIVRLTVYKSTGKDKKVTVGTDAENIVKIGTVLILDEKEIDFGDYFEIDRIESVGE